jgi:D-lactate dehydrogenase (cytochrome)
MEIPESVTNDRAQELLAGLLEGRAEPPDGPLMRLFRILMEHDALEDLEFAFPEDRSRSDALKEFREAVPKRINELLAARRRSVEGVKKVGGDLIVPTEHLEEMLRLYEEGFRNRGLRFAIWGHVSDGNLHPNAIPEDARQVELGYDALLEFAAEAKRRGGCPLSEHGVGRNPVKQEMLRRFVGGAGIESMKAVKQALDPEWRFAPGVLFRPVRLPPTRSV